MLTRRILPFAIAAFAVAFSVAFVVAVLVSAVTR